MRQRRQRIGHVLKSIQHCKPILGGGAIRLLAISRTRTSLSECTLTSTYARHMLTWA
jgi:hypothetical protein